ncbi:MAG: PKD domain-containing protein [Ignavibacteriales bacterium]|nr:PKD domain-containing protein [Ignavibacteriales bacterium]
MCSLSKILILFILSTIVFAQSNGKTIIVDEHFNLREIAAKEFGEGATPIHIYDKPGKYKVTVTITGDLKGNCDNVFKMI